MVVRARAPQALPDKGVGGEVFWRDGDFFVDQRRLYALLPPCWRLG